MTGAGDETSQPVLAETVGTVRLLTLNRPEVLNAVNAKLATQLGEHLEAAEADHDVDVVVLTGAGRAFCAGSDMRVTSAGGSVLPQVQEWGYAGIVRHRIGKPVVAAVNGDCYGGGFEIVLACDMAVAAAGARFALPETRRGRIAGAGGLVRLPHRIPLAVVLELAMTGRPMTADQALRWGLVNDVVQPGRLREAALELAHTVAESSPLALQATKRIVYESAERGEAAAWTLNAAQMTTIAESADAIEGATAFREKRPPRWTGR
jgi:crotonobetainyl-CoA hydratase